MVDSPGEAGFERLLAYSAQAKSVELEGRMKNWRFRDTVEETSVCLTAGEQKSMVVVAGHQLVSEEGLEVLAVGTRNQIESNRPADRLVRKVAQAGGLPVVPWGVGKWMGTRRSVIEQLLQDATLPRFFLGDSANRPTFWPTPSLFRQAEERKIKNLPGSDPLPFPAEVQRVGSFGVVLDGSLDPEKPAQDLKQTLLDPSTTFHQFGEGETPGRFVRNQLKMQFRKLTQ